MSLKQNNKKIKSFQAFFFLMILGLLVLGVGQIIIIDKAYNSSLVSISIERSQKIGQTINYPAEKTQESFYIAASKSGTKYYYRNCAGLGRIKPENLTFFGSESQAEGAGYSLAKNCQKP